MRGITTTSMQIQTSMNDEIYIPPYDVKEWDDYADMTMLIVAIPTPPCPVHKDALVLMPDSFTSKSFDGDCDLGDGFQILGVKPTRNLGPAFLVSAKLSRLVRSNKKRDLHTNIAAFCAGISYFSVEISRVHYGVETNIDRLSTVGGSCHQGSHFTIPEAPYLTAVLQQRQAPSSGKLAVDYLTPAEAELVFPQIDFTMNREPDRFISTCSVDPACCPYRRRSGVGKWAEQYLKTLRYNGYRKTAPLFMEQHSA